jgi:hypothetical protein
MVLKARSVIGANQFQLAQPTQADTNAQYLPGAEVAVLQG